MSRNKSRPTDVTFSDFSKRLTLCLCVIVSMSILNITVRDNIKKKMSRLSFVLSEFMSQSLPLKKNNLLEFTVPVIALQQKVGETRLLISTNMFEV